MKTPHSYHHAQKHFQRHDPLLHAAMKKIKPFEITKSNDSFLSLCREIIGQQLSSKAAHTILNRFVDLFPQKKVTPEEIQKISEEKIRNAGPSWAKVSFIKDLAAKVVNKDLHLAKFDNLDDSTVIAELTQVKGIGPWTAEMFLMFSLGRHDVFSYGDLGLRKGIQKLYQLKALPTQKQMEPFVKKWIPYRTYAARILWESLEI